MFEDHIQYLLALISQSEVRLLGVAFSKARGELTMYLTQISVPTDGVVMLSAHALSTGQLIMGGQDGHLYELEYEVCGWLHASLRGRLFSSLFKSTR